MTTNFTQAWPAVLPERAKADAPRQDGKRGETGFAEAVKFSAAGKQARHPVAADAVGEAPRARWNVELSLPDRTAGKTHAAGANDARRQWDLPAGLAYISVDPKDADSRKDPNAVPAEQQDASEKPTATASETMPIALRPQVPPMILLGGFGRLEAGAASDGDLASPTASTSRQEDTVSPPPGEPAEAHTTPAKAAVVAAPAVAAAAVAMPLQGKARTAPAETTVAQPMTEPGAKVAGSEAEPEPAPTLGQLDMKPQAGAQSGAASINETSKPVVAEAAARPDATAASTIARDSLRENTPDRPGQTARVTVIAQHNVPAPATPFPGLTAAPLLTAIAADGSWRDLTAVDLRPLPAQNAVASAHSLKVQLHPAELGIVTASLRFAGEQLTVELQVESVEAHQRLSADSDTIVKSLRALGLEVDRVTIQQSLVVQAPNARADMNAGQNGQPAPDRQSFNATNSGSGNGQAGGQHSGRETSNGAQASHNTAPGSADRAGGGLYI
jgi:chemotaxis protein MotD